MKKYLAINRGVWLITKNRMANSFIIRKIWKQILSRKKNYGNKKKNIQCILKNVWKKSNEKRKLMKKATKKILSWKSRKKINNVNEWNDVLNQKCLKLDSIKSHSKVCIVSSGFQYIYIFFINVSLLLLIQT